MMRKNSILVKTLLLFTLCVSSYAEESLKEADCIILEDENSIVCKYTHTRVNYDKTVIVEWLEPNGTVSRSRKMLIPAGHGSVYDFRYIKGRAKGEWTFRVVDKDTITSTKFSLN